MSVFINVGPNLNKEIPESKVSFTNYLKNPSCVSMFLTPTDPKEIDLLLKNLDESKSTDIYGTSIKLLKIASSSLSKVLSEIINHSLVNGIFPEKLKCAYVHISILPILSKIFEKVVSTRLMKFLKSINAIFEHQFGFQAGKSTDLAILDIHSKIVEAFENKELACCVFLDFAKAFDTVNHKILIRKLEYYGIRGSVLKWFESLLMQSSPMCQNRGIFI